MARSKTVSIIIMVLLTFVSAGWCEPTVGLNVSGLYRVEVGSADLREISEVIRALTSSPGVMNQAAESAYGRRVGDSLRLDSSGLNPQREGVLFFEAGFDGLPEEGREKAQVFLRNVAERLEKALLQSFKDGQERLKLQLDKARQRQHELDHTLGSVKSPRAASKHIKQQLDTTVDLSMLRPDMSASEAFEVIRHAVDPPLNVVVMWKAMLDLAEVEPSTPIDMDGLPIVRLGTGLDMICKALGGGFYRIGFKLQDEVIMVAPQETLDRLTPSEPDRSGTSQSFAPAYKLMERCQDLVDKRNDLSLEVSQMEATQKATEKEIQRLRHDIEQKLKESATDLGLESLLQAMQERRARLDQAIAVGQASADDLVEVLHKLAEVKMRIADYRMNLVANHGGKIQQELNLKLAQLAVDLAGRQAELSAITSQLRQLEHQLETANTSETQQIARDLDRSALEKVMKRIHELEEKLDQSFAPSVTLVEAGQ